MMVYIICRKFTLPPTAFRVISVYEDKDEAYDALEKKQEKDCEYLYHFIVAKQLKEKNETLHIHS